MTRVTEAALADLWRSGILCGRELSDAEGRGLRVLSPGLPGDGKGPDFRDAAFAWRAGPACRRRKGDVELHTDSRLWRQHGHQRDPAFNGVVLHVVASHRPGSLTVLEDGGLVPVLAVGGYLDARDAGLPALPCRSLVEERRRDVLLRLGERRFRIKAARFAAGIAAEGPGQALYSGVMEALGYEPNRRPFVELARRLPLARLERGGSLLGRESMLFGAAGLLVGQRGLPGCGGPYPAELELSALRLQAMEGPMDFAEWELLRVRKQNSPPRRLAAMARLAGHGGLLHRVVDAVAGDGGGRPAHAVLCVGAEGYWAAHWDFGRPCPPSALLGVGRAADIMVNVALPFAFALPGRSAALRRAAREAYRSHPALGENRVTRFMQVRLWGDEGASPLSACEQQGLLHLYRRYCGCGDCGGCPLARPGGGM